MQKNIIILSLYQTTNTKYDTTKRYSKTTQAYSPKTSNNRASEPHTLQRVASSGRTARRRYDAAVLDDDYNDADCRLQHNYKQNQTTRQMIEAEENHLYSLIINYRFGDDIHLNVTIGELRRLAQAVECITLTKQAMYES